MYLLMCAEMLHVFVRNRKEGRIGAEEDRQNETFIKMVYGWLFLYTILIPSHHCHEGKIGINS